MSIQRLLLILVENAFRYTEPPGLVSITLTVQEDDAIIEVSDSGIGIPPDEIPRIFERFYRASNARFFNPAGTGLGLPIADWIATAHGGRLTLRSTLGVGTRMSVRLPMRSALGR